MAKAEKLEQAQKKIGKTVNEASEVLQERVEKTYDDVIDKLKDERDWLETELKHEYRNARRYVRANPEQGVGIALAAGFFVGVLIGRAIR
ncbi:MAG: DUF883 family protein [Balneolaceae bacterium]|nr:DUF883 family protein [Balneolaceae bacterium]MBO6546502.1 DUF883 family protein [Balneolaceae bacterium]MBO6648861.1 DUF883 family protein [Balneolaceae bacterium]